MKKTKLNAMLFMSLLAALLTVNSVAHAQDGSKQGQRMEQRVKNMTDSMQVRLALNDNQYKQVYAINNDFAAKMKDIRTSDAGKLERAKQLKSLMKDRDNSLKGVLTADQFKNFKAMEAERKEAMRERRKGETTK